jgi:5'-nucleotidase/UDP-sugar diphosphatase
LYAAGEGISRRDVQAELPFSNNLVVIQISGRDLKAGLENGVSQLPKSSGRFPQVSGITMDVDVARPAGQRIVALQVAGAPLDPARIYRVATNDFLASGRDGYVTFGTAKPLLPPRDSPPLANEVMEYLHNFGTVRADIEGRIKLR